MLSWNAKENVFTEQPCGNHAVKPTVYVERRKEMQL